MLKAKVIGIGAAGNKGAIQLLESKVMESSDVLLLNSTLKDVPAAYKQYAIEFVSDNKGCAKQRNLGTQIAVNNLSNGDINLDGFLDPSDKMVIICNSSEGGTGCGASTAIAQYFKDVLGVVVHMFVFTGFEDDIRGLKNTVEYFKDLQPEYVVQGISNKKFLSECNGNKIKAEQAANEEFVERVRILLGKTIVDSEQNIDDTDLLRLTTRPGYMSIEHGNLGKVKNVEDFNKVLASIIDNTKALDFEPTCKMYGVILNVREKTKDCIDFKFGVIKEKLGDAVDTFLHIQDVHEEEYIQIIASGMKMPMAEIQAVHDEFVQRLSKQDRSGDDFFNSEFDTNIDTIEVGGRVTSTVKLQENKANFFKSFGATSTQQAKGKVVNAKVSDEI